MPPLKRRGIFAFDCLAAITSKKMSLWLVLSHCEIGEAELRRHFIGGVYS
jgi:hypothetical protein